MTIYAVNGKEPIAAWIPSLDTAGNGTTTLTDLVGSNDGTLTDMDAATDWVADTNAGGIRALNLDGGNDHIVISDDPLLSFGDSSSSDDPFSVSVWVNLADVTNATLFSKGDLGPPQQLEYNFGVNGSNELFLVIYDLIGGNNIRCTSDNAVTALEGTWAHLVCTYDGSESESGIQLWINGSQPAQTQQAFGSYSAMHNTSHAVTIGRNFADGSNYAEGLYDDARLFGAELDSSDVAYLYNSGAGRGIVTGIARSHINAGLVNSPLIGSLVA